MTDGNRVDANELRDLLTAIETIAVVGIKPGERDDAFRVPRYMQAQGYRIIPVSPKLSTVLGEPVIRSLLDLDGPVDLVNLFRAAEHIRAHTDEILSMTTRPRAVWMQLGIRHEESAARLRDVGVCVIEDRCLMVEHRRLTTSGNGATTRPGEE